MPASTPRTQPGTRSAPALLLTVALGLFLVAHGAPGIGTNDHHGIRLVLQWFQVAAGLAFLVAAALGVVRAVRAVRARER